MTDDNRPNPATTSTLTWLHLSDFHFKAEYDEHGKLKTNWQRDKVLEDLMRDVIVKLPEHGLAPDLVFITGDIAHSGKPDEYDVARIFFDSLADELKHHPAKQWFLVPGNHDVDRERVDVSDEGMRDFLTEALVKKIMDSSAMKRYATRQEAFLNFTKHFLGSKRPWQAEAPWQVYDFEKAGMKLAVLQLNSAWAAQDDDDEGKLLIGEYQLREALKTANAMNPHLKIALFHHPEEVLRDFDQSALDGYLCQSDGCHFLLRGHMHKTKLKMGKTPNGESFSLAAGACWQDSEYPHSAMVVQLDLATQMGTAHVWTYTPNDGGFWSRDTKLYRKMENGEWPFELPKSWNLSSRLVPTTHSPDSENLAAKPKFDGLLIPDSYRAFIEMQYTDVESMAGTEKPLHFRLDQIYVPGSTDWFSPEEREARDRQMHEAAEKAKGSDKARSAHNREDAELPKLRLLAELLDLPQHRHFLMVGGAGCGKSTFLRFSAVQILKKRDRLPILLELKEFGTWLKNREGNSPDLLVEWAGTKLENLGLPEHAIRSRLGQEKVLWLLDGYDEIFDTGIGGRVAQMLGQWISGERGSRDWLILTSRPHAVAREGVIRALCLSNRLANIAELEPKDQKVFLQRWFEAVYSKGDSRVKDVLEKLIPAIGHHEALQALRGNPLMLSTIATIYYQGKELPERRADLYGKTVDILLRRRFGASVEGGSDDLVRRIFDGLFKVAREMMEHEQVRDLGEPDFLEWFRQGFYKDRKPSQKEELELRQIMRNLGTHSGLIKLLGDPPRYGFLHFSFQEYLTARSFAEERDPFRQISAHLEEGAWREVVLLTAGHLFETGPTFRGQDFVAGILGKCPKKSKVCGALIVAARAAAEAPSNAIKEGSRKALIQQILSALESKNPSSEKDRFSLGMDLGKLGDPRLGMEKAGRWVWIEPGSFEVGRTDGRANEKPVQRVEITSGFWLGKYPVTNEEYQKFVDGKGYETEGWWGEAGWQWLQDQKEKGPKKYPSFGGANQPVVGVCCYEAEAYCRWLSEQFKNDNQKPAWVPDGYRVVLPTEAQWEYVARGETGRPYPWGKEGLNEQRANYDQRLKQTSPVGIYPLGATPQGVLDLSGNVWEWCLDPWEAHAYKKRKAGEKDPVAVGDKSEGEDIRVVRGGSWIFDAGWLAGASRDRGWAGDRGDDLGFRCCLSRCP